MSSINHHPSPSDESNPSLIISKNGKLSEEGFDDHSPEYYVNRKKAIQAAKEETKSILKQERYFQRLRDQVKEEYIQK